MMVGALIPIRLDSTRLPQKALQDVGGLSALQRLITQTVACGRLTVEQIVVCTTERPQDDALVSAVERIGARIFRGNTDDLIDRLHRAAAAFGFEVILQVDGDDISADPSHMAACVDAVVQGKGEVACCGPGLPLGAASKAFRAACLRKIFETYVPGQNDSGFSYYLTRSGLFEIATVGPLDPSHVLPQLRLTLDYPEDLALFRAVYGALRGPQDRAVGIGEINTLVRSRPQLLQINSGLDEGYWARTRELMARSPLKLRVGAELRQLDIK